MGGIKSFLILVVVATLAGCSGQSRSPQQCRNWIQNPAFENQAAGWRLPPFARLEEPAEGGGIRSLVIGEGSADGAVAQLIPRPAELSGLGVIAVGYARVEVREAPAATDEDLTPRLWDGTVNLANGYSKNGRDFESPYVRLRFTGREVASGLWKRFVTEAIPARRARLLYPHFAFWGARLAPGVKLHLAAISLVEAPADDAGEPESWAACPKLLAPAPALVSATHRQWKRGLAPDGAFEEVFGLAVRRIASEASARELQLTARYRQGPLAADRYLISVTEDGSDPRLSPTSRITTVLARQEGEQWETMVRVKAEARVAIAVAAAAASEDGLKTQAPLLPAAWQKPRL